MKNKINKKSEKALISLLEKKGFGAYLENSSILVLFADKQSKIDQESLDAISLVETVGQLSLSNDLEISDSRLKSLLSLCSGIKNLQIGNGKKLTNKSVELLAECNELLRISLCHYNFLDEYLQKVPTLKSILLVDFSFSKISKKTLSIMLEKFPAVREIVLRGTNVAQSSLDNLTSFPDLAGITLDECSIDNNCFKVFLKMPKLGLIQLRETKVSLAAAKKFTDAQKDRMVVLGDFIDDLFLNEDTFDLAAYSDYVTGANS